MDLDFLTARLHARRSRLAEGDRLEELVRTRSVEDLLRRLFPAGDVRSLPDAQRRLIEDMGRELQFLAASLSGPAARFVEWLLVRLQVENLKVLGRAFSTGRDGGRAAALLIALPEPWQVDGPALAAAPSIESFCASLPDACWRDALAPVIPLYRLQPRPFYIETALDQAYFTELLLRAQALPRPDREPVLRLARLEADTFLLMLAARGRFLYGLEPERLAPFYVPGAGISADRFGALLHAADVRAAVGLLARAGWEIPAPVMPAGVGDNGDADLAIVERVSRERLYHAANRLFRRSHNGLGAVAAFTLIRRVEVANLVTLTEGVRAGLSPADLRARLTPAPAAVSEARGV
jgi:vacuolar-type H+-ATPase subunit C/Vma6